MAQHAQQRQQGGGRTAQPPAQRTANQQISDQARLRERANWLFSEIRHRQAMITAMLAGSVPFETFVSIVTIAIDNNPDILECWGPSVLNACIKAAYDGLMPDGRQAAIIPSKNKISKPNEAPRYRKEARYQSMVAGLRMQILRGGKVEDLQTAIVYSNEVKEARFKYTRGASPNIDHEPIVDTNMRGEPVGAYSIAWLANGRVSIEYMTKVEIEAVRDAAQSGPVWKGPYALEMWRKSVLRRHRKSLPGGNDIVDMEARVDFPQFAGSEVPAAPVPDRPSRRDYPALAHQPGDSINDFGGMDVGGGGLSDAEIEDEERAIRGDPPKAQSAQQQQMRAAEPPREEGLSAEQPMPDTAEAWEQWADRVKTAIAGAGNVDAINTLRREQQSFIDAAPAALAEEIDTDFFDAIEGLTNPQAAR